MLQVLSTPKLNPNKLSFLQAQVLIKIYSRIREKKFATREEIAELTDYPMGSKIVEGVIVTLNEKGFIEGNFEEGFFVPKSATKIFEKVVNKIDYKHKKYSEKLLKIAESDHTKISEDFNNKSYLNASGCVHKWYNYLEEFPFSLIEEKFKEYKVKANSLVVDPFSGSGTTLITSKLFNCRSIGFDSNPLMTFISKTKTEWEIDLKLFKKTVQQIAKKFLERVHNLDEETIRAGFLKTMPKKEINQWLSVTMQKEVGYLKDLIEKNSKGKIKQLLLLALGKACFDASYVSLCPGTTFYPFKEKEDFWTAFTKKIYQIVHDLHAVQNHGPYPEARLIHDSCLNASKHIDKNSIDFIITSPPYPNDLEYTRQTRLELYLLDFVKNMNDVQMIKRDMVKSSTKLIFKESSSEKFVEKFKDVKIISDNIYEQTKEKNWGFDYPRMVREYFGDMYLCLKTFYPLLKNRGKFHLVVGDQTIKSVYIPVCDILIDMAKEIGYRSAHKELFRMRRSTGHSIQLPEEIVILEK